MPAKTPRGETSQNDAASTMSTIPATRGGLTRSTVLSSFEEEGPDQRDPCHSHRQLFMTVIGELSCVSQDDHFEEAEVTRSLPREIHIDDDDSLFMGYLRHPAREVTPTPVDRRTLAARSDDRDGRSRRRRFPLLMDHMG
ncbi:hypothetical protein TraAM80_06498 [Trypanosoma rangeli]|uniref:Uncharacterized protein n=1 Tax=Trypanosoma rangeli TaxID=5698 RepID=A0A3S5IQT5_TRYRA|nr:uncharacterized protein TraAM80_06498 [Trypanosoma rangeli]RNF02267.1 hypothetical protein TraAM80_06498 [Trypanosoma rangeli]|eukprot:RNF02267.1 hypothetical protein TraAM80_06498 [Trypanosoma rangeli]